MNSQNSKSKQESTQNNQKDNDRLFEDFTVMSLSNQSFDDAPLDLITAVVQSEDETLDLRLQHTPACFPPLPEVGTHIPLIDGDLRSRFLLPQDTDLELTPDAQMFEALLNYNDLAPEFQPQPENGLMISDDFSTQESLTQTTTLPLRPASRYPEITTFSEIVSDQGASAYREIDPHQELNPQEELCPSLGNIFDIELDGYQLPQTPERETNPFWGVPGPVLLQDQLLTYLETEEDQVHDLEDMTRSEDDPNETEEAKNERKRLRRNAMSRRNYALKRVKSQPRKLIKDDPELQKQQKTRKAATDKARRARIKAAETPEEREVRLQHDRAVLKARRDRQRAALMQATGHAESSDRASAKARADARKENLPGTSTSQIIQPSFGSRFMMQQPQPMAPNLFSDPANTITNNPKPRVRLTQEDHARRDMMLPMLMQMNDQLRQAREAQEAAEQAITTRTTSEQEENREEGQTIIQEGRPPANTQSQASNQNSRADTMPQPQTNDDDEGGSKWDSQGRRRSTRLQRRT